MTPPFLNIVQHSAEQKQCSSLSGKEWDIDAIRYMSIMYITMSYTVICGDIHRMKKPVCSKESNKTKI
jgi:hypothetical protein